MLAELSCTPINGVFALLAQPFADHRGAFLNAFKDCFPARSDANNTRYRKRCTGRSELVGAPPRNLGGSGCFAVAPRSPIG